jgi:hypothetical protein
MTTIVGSPGDDFANRIAASTIGKYADVDWPISVR